MVPRGAVRRRQIVEVAERVFLANGYVDTTMLMVAEAAGASKLTLYRHFGSKDDLFAEVVKNRSLALNGSLDAILERSGGLEDVLRNVGVTLLTDITRPSVVSLIRMVAAETPRNPILGRIMHGNGPAAGVTLLADYLRRDHAKSPFVREDPERAANIFFSALIGHIVLDVLFLVEIPAPTPEEIKRRVACVVAMFLDLPLA